MQLKSERTKKFIIVILACSLMACSLFLIKSFTSAGSDEPTAAQTAAESQQRMQSQINNLSNKISSLTNVVSQLQSPTKKAVTSIDQPASSETDTLAAEVKSLAEEADSLQAQVSELQNWLKTPDGQNLATKIDTLQTQVAELQGKLKVAETTIGITPIAMNGLSVMFITSDVEMGVTRPPSPSAVQFAIKVINTTSSALTNVDVTGTITGSHSFYYEPLAPGYPQLTDGAGLCSYVFYIKQGQTMNFEAFGSGKTSLSIPLGGSVTLRPKISMLPPADGELSAMTLHIALKAITYDLVPAK